MRSMQACWPRIVLALVLTLSSENVLAQDPIPEMWESWGKPLADKLERFLPGPMSGLIESTLWDEWETRRPVDFFNCSNEGCQRFLPVLVSTGWRMADPVLVQQVEAAKKQLQEELEEPTWKEAENRLTALQAMARRLVQSVEANQTPDHRFGPEAKQIGTLKGYPLYRFAVSDEPYGATSEQVVLWVYLGPAGFKNPMEPNNEKVRTELKCLLVGAEIRSTPEAVKADEALAKQMLEKVDYAGLAKLIQP